MLSTILYIPHNIVKKKAQITFRFLNPGLQLERLVYNPLYYESSVLPFESRVTTWFHSSSAPGKKINVLRSKVKISEKF